ncbi:MAG: class I SAM-dependent methyltransferase [Lentisphaerae bacterium]|nr:class I SAM-dependent methyltransferase [Lentisphaerota bacterium]
MAGRLTQGLKTIAKKFHRGIIYPPFNDPISYRPLRIDNHAMQVLAGFVPFLARNSYDWCVNERILEIPFVFMNLNLPVGSKVLDFGCDASRISMHLANMGYKVTGADLLPYAFSHPNLEFKQGNFFEQNLISGSFDGIIAVSALEHVGLGAYGEMATPERGDVQMVQEFARILKSKGRLIVTVPFGQRKQVRTHRIYDRDELMTVLSGFHIEKEVYYRCEGRKYWYVENAEILEKQPTHDGKFEAAAMIVAVKR